jgi:hypothetical protein
MIKRRPTCHRSHLRDNRWRGTLPEAYILIRKLLGLSTSKYLDRKFGVMDFGLDPRVSGCGYLYGRAHIRNE